MIVHRLVDVFPYACAGDKPLVKSFAAGKRIGNRPFKQLGRRSLASKFDPGYDFDMVRGRLLCVYAPGALPETTTWTPSLVAVVLLTQCLYHFFASASFDFWQPSVSYGWNRYIVSSKQKQSTFTGKQQRNAVNAFPLVVPGLFARLSGNPSPGEATPGALLYCVEELPVQAVGAAAGSTVPVGAVPSVNDNQAQDGENTECNKEPGDDGDQIETDDDTPAVMPGYKYNWVAYRAAFGNTPFPQAVTAMCAEYAVICARISGQVGESFPPPMTLAVGSEISQQATAWVN